MAKAPLTLVKPATAPPSRITVGTELQTAAHSLSVSAGRIVGAIGRNWTTEAQIAAAEAECLEIAERALATARMLRRVR